MLTDDELSLMRSDGEASLPDTCTILATVETSDGMGGKAAVWSAVATAVPCRMSPVSGAQRRTEDALAGAMQAETDWLLTLHWDQPIVTTDRIEWDFKRFEVQSIGAVRTYQLFRRVGLVLLGEGQ